MRAVRRALQRALGDDPDFLKLWSGGFVSTLGFHISALAMQLTAAVVLSATPFEMGVLGAAQYLPRFLLGLPAGAWVDRVRRRPLMIVADLGRAGLLASIPIAHVLGWLGMPQLYVVALGMGAFSTFFEVSILSYLPALVGRPHLVEANSRLHAGEAVAQVGGPNIAGILVQWLTAPIAIGVDAISYVVSALFLAAIRRPEPARTAHVAGGGALWAEIREGVGVVTRHALLRPLVATGITVGLFTGGVRGALIVVYLVEIGVTPIEFGLIYGVGGGVALIGAIVARPVARGLGLGRTLIAAQLVAAAFAAFVPLAGLAPGASLAILLAGQVGLGLAAPIWGVNGGSLQQVVTPDRLLGRGTATQRFAVAGVHPVGAIFGGWLASTIGLQSTLAIAAAGAALGALWLAVSPVRQLAQMPVPIEAANGPAR